MKAVKANILILFFLGYFSVHAQTFIDGIVLDSVSKSPISYANIYIKGTTIGVTTDDTGYFKLPLTQAFDSITAAYLGYEEKTIRLSMQSKQRLVFLLSSSANTLAETVIVANKESLEDYLIRKILENKEKNDKKHLQNYSYELYNKIELEVKNMSDKFMNRKILKPFKFVFDN
ncbi:MAG TPA: carboxypeptidase-like regulatory domain-containing protein, partial [Chitinophagales bacterium]|nr:carboxypeptidase-like regulatory domain-containing protein [Chitinophagales bacterium]